MSTQIFNLPDLGEGLTEADLVNWLVEEGQTISVDQPIAEVETAKALVEVPSPYGGTVLTLHGKPGETLMVGNPLITVGDEAAESPERPGALDYREEEQAGIAVPEETDDESSGSVLIGYGTSGGGASGRTRAPKRAATPTKPRTDQPATVAASSAPRVISPLVRQLAKRNNIDVTHLSGSGQGGIIVRADVLAAIDAPTASSQPEATAVATDDRDSRSGLTIVDRVPMTGVRKMVAEQMVRSRTNIPEATAWLDVDVTELIELRARLK